MGSLQEARPAQFVPARISPFSRENRDRSIRTIPELVEYNARHNADHVFCVQTEKRGDDSRIITYGQLKQAILNCSRWLVNNIHDLEIPRKNENGEFIKGKPVALFMESNVGILIHLLSLLSLGVPVRNLLDHKEHMADQLLRRFCSPHGLVLQP